MNTEIDTQHYKKLLEIEKATLEKELSTIARKNPENEGDWEAVEKNDIEPAEEGEIADNMQEYAENTAVSNQLEVQLKEVNDALERINDGTYGACIVCQNAIEEDRLNASPSAKTCKAHMNG